MNLGSKRVAYNFCARPARDQKFIYWWSDTQKLTNFWKLLRALFKRKNCKEQANTANLKSGFILYIWFEWNHLMSVVEWVKQFDVYNKTVLHIHYTVGEKKDSTKRYLWSKTILTAGIVGGPGFDPPLRKINSFFHRTLALSVPIYRHFQSNGANWRSSKHLTKKFI